MRSLNILSGAYVLLALCRGAPALVARAQLPPTVTSSFLGSATDYPDLNRDGGGGGTVNEMNVVSTSPRAPVGHRLSCEPFL